VVKIKSKLEVEKFDDYDQEILKSIIDCIYEAVCVIDENGNVKIWNKSAEKLYHVKHEDIINKDISLYFPNAIINEVRESKKTVENKQHLPRKDSSILASARPLYIENKFRGAVSTDRDFDEVLNLYNELDKANSKLIFLENEIKKYSGIFGNIIGNSSVIMNRISMARQIAPANTSVMITGESGTGKEVFARGIHELSGKKGLFVPVNCSAIPHELFESEFFGYCSGAFTGASNKGKMGIFELANEGTVFLDEIGDMPFHMQAKLLRVLQEKEFVKVGGEKPVKVDVRVISATNKDLKSMVKNGSFRDDLYYRLNVVEICLPPLRERLEDIPAFINHFVKEFSSRNNKNIKGVNMEVVNQLLKYEWPGNIRELMNVIEHMVVISNSEIIKRGSIPEYVMSRIGAGDSVKKYPLDLTVAIRELEMENIERALKLCNGNKLKAAKVLNIPRGTLYHKIEKYGMNC